MSNIRHRTIPNRTKHMNITMLGQDYFKQQNPSVDEKSKKVKQISEQLPRPDYLGDYANNHSFYLNSIELLMAASFEREHAEEIMKREIIDRLKNFSKFLDIGVGSSEVTRFIGQHFEEITVIDNNQESLSNMPDYYGSKNNTVTKRHESILDVELESNSYDLILVSQTLYYIEPRFRTGLVNMLYKALNPSGILSFVYNNGLGRSQLAETFSNNTDNLSGFAIDVMNRYGDAASAVTSIEIMNSVDIWPMMHITGLMLFDAGAKVDKDTLASYLEHNAYNDTHYQMDMIQNFVFIGASDDIE